MSSHLPKKKRRRVTKFRLDETSVVDTPAHEPARIAIMKREADTLDVELLQKNRLAMTTLTAGHSHTLVLVSANSEGMSELKAGHTSFADGHVHDWIMDDAGNILISDADAHSHGLSALVKAADDITTETLTEGLLASLASDQPQANDPGDIMSKNDSTPETPVVTPEELAKVEQRAERAESIVKLSPEQREYFGSLQTDSEQDEFLGTDSKDAIVKNAADADPVVHTDLDGNEIRKSEGATVLRLAKQNDELRKNAAKTEAITKRAGFEKRAGEELQHLTGESTVKADLLEAVETLPIEKRAPVMEILKSKDAGMAKAFETLGTSESSDGVDANAKIEKIAKNLREKDPTLSPERAYVAALDTPEGRELHVELAGN